MKSINLAIISIVFLSLFLIPLGFAQEKYSYIDATLTNQDPYPAEPNNYVEFLIKFENHGLDHVGDFMTEILPEYPFSLDPGSNGVVKIGNIDGLQRDGEAIFVKYRIRIDKDAIDGDNNVKIRYTYNTNGLWDNYWEEEFPININDPKTDFDVAVQDYSYKTNSLSIAVSNTGDEDANSVTVYLPEQDSIEILGSNKNIVGTIDSYDYTIASFKVISKKDAPLIVKISYTDSIGVRREVEKAILFSASTYNQNVQTTKTNGDGLNKSLIYIAVGIIGIIILFILFKILRKKRKTKS